MAGGGYDGQSSGLEDVESCRNLRKVGGLHSAEFGISMGCHGEHFVTDGEALCPGAELQHRP